MEKMNENQKQLVMDNLKLVHYVIHNKFQYYVKENIEYKELEQEGYLGLCKAAMLYDDKVSGFSTYAVNWIWGSIKSYLDKKTGWTFHIRSLSRTHYNHIPFGSLNMEISQEQGLTHELFEFVPDESNTYDEIILLCDALIAFKQASPKYGEDIFRMVNDGFTQREIGNRLGIRQTYVSRIIKRAKGIYDNSGR